MCLNFQPRIIECMCVLAKAPLLISVNIAGFECYIFSEAGDIVALFGQGKEWVRNMSGIIL